MKANLWPREPDSSSRGSASWIHALLERETVERGDLLCIHNLEGRLLFTNPAPAQLLGYSVEELLRMPMRELVVPEFRAEFDAYLHRIRQAGEDSGYLAVMTRSGERRIWQYHNRLHTEATPSAVVSGRARDVTEQKRLDSLLKASEARLRILLDQTSDGIFLADSQGRYLDVNPAGAAMLGYTQSEILQRNIADIVVPEEVPRLQPEITSLLSGCSVRAEWRFRRKDGSIFPGQVVARALPDRRLQGILRDLSDRQQSEEALRASEKRLAGLVSSAMDAIISVDEEQRITLFNAAAEKVFGCPAAEAMGQPIERFIPERFRRAHADHVQKFGQTGASGRSMTALGELCALRADGREFPIEASISRTEASGWKILTVILRDITERKHAGEALRASEERMRLAQQVAHIGTFERNMRTGEGFWAHETERMFGLQPGQGPKSLEEFFNLIHPEDRQHVQGLLDESTATGTTAGEWRVIWPDGSVHWIDGRWKVFKDEQGRPVRAIGIDTDITERKRAEEILCRREERYRALVQASAQIVWTARPDGDQHGEAMPEWQTFTGQTTEEMSGRGRLNAIHPEDRQKTIEVWERAVAAGHATEFENRLRRHDGVYRDMLVRAVPVSATSCENGTVRSSQSLGRKSHCGLARTWTRPCAKSRSVQCSI